MFDLDVMKRHQVTLRENSSDEILETVKEVEALANGSNNLDYDLLADWQKCLSIPHYYGNAKPSRYFLEKYHAAFLD
jgi:hypothetical protein